VSPRKAAAKRPAKKAAASTTSSPTRGKFVAFDRTRGITVGGIRDNREDAQTIVDGLIEAGYAGEVRPA